MTDDDFDDKINNIALYVRRVKSKEKNKLIIKIIDCKKHEDISLFKDIIHKIKLDIVFESLTIDKKDYVSLIEKNREILNFYNSITDVITFEFLGEYPKI